MLPLALSKCSGNEAKSLTCHLDANHMPVRWQLDDWFACGWQAEGVRQGKKRAMKVGCTLDFEVCNKWGHGQKAGVSRGV